MPNLHMKRETEEKPCPKSHSRKNQRSGLGLTAKSMHITTGLPASLKSTNGTQGGRQLGHPFATIREDKGENKHFAFIDIQIWDGNKCHKKSDKRRRVSVKNANFLLSWWCISWFSNKAFTVSSPCFRGCSPTRRWQGSSQSVSSFTSAGCKFPHKNHSTALQTAPLMKEIKHWHTTKRWQCCSGLQNYELRMLPLSLSYQRLGGLVG